MGKYNVDLMLAVREQIASHPETHDQGMWARRTECGTTHCIAGWACLLSGEQLRWFEAEDDEDPDVVFEVANYTAQDRPIWDRAADLLGLDTRTAGNLFHTWDARTALAALDELIEKGKNQP